MNLPALQAGAVAPAPPTVLCIDDEPNVLRALKRLFRPEGYRIHTADTGAEGLALLEREPVDLVMSDLRMPGLNGAAVLEQVRSRWPDTIRMLLTGQGDLGATIDAINRGEIYRYIPKPWDDRTVILEVRHALEHRALQREKNALQELTRAQNAELHSLNETLEQKVTSRTKELQTALGSLEAANDRLRKTFLTSIKVFGNLIEIRSGAMAGHSQRVADLAWRLAGRMGLSAADAQDVLVAAMLHDIGKLGLPDRLHAKPFSALNADERASVARHPEKAEAALMALEQLAGAATLIRHHHELFNGSGYPSGVSGESIPVGARILTVANEYDSLRLGTLFPKRYDANEAKEYLIRSRGTRYDPIVVDAFVDMISGSNGREATAVREVSMRTGQLREGMRLSRNLTARDGMMLLARNYVLDASLIRRIQAFERTEGHAFEVWVTTTEEEKCIGC